MYQVILLWYQFLKLLNQKLELAPFLSHASSPFKFVPYTNLAAGGSLIFPNMHMVGPIINRGQPHRFTIPIILRSGQLMYMQPISQDLVQGAPNHPQLPSRPLFPPQQIQYPKYQSLIATGQPMQLYATQPFAANGHQPYLVMPTDILIMQPPFPTNRPMSVPVPNGFFGTKFL